MSQTQVKTAAGDWDMSYFFPGYLGAEYEEACQAYRQGVARATLDAQAISALSLDTLPQVAAILHQWEELYQLGTKLGTYLGCLRAADGRDEKVAQEYAALQALGAEQKKLDVILLSLLKQAGEEAFQGLLDEPSLKSAAFRLERWRQMAQFQMAPDLETLAADLEIDGLSAWGRLYDQVSSRLEFDMPDGQGGVKKVPMALRRSLTESPDAAVRKAAHVNSNKSWAEVEDVCAACLNAIAGTRLTLYKKRNIPHFLTHPLFEAAISHKTLAAMFAAIRTRFELPREYLRLKAKIIGRPKLGAQDIYCPLPLNDDQRVSWSQAGKWLDQAYSQSYPAFSEFCRQALSRNWIDYQPRDGKRQGGFCTSPISEGESRIFMTFNETMGDVQTLAHELGHAFHNHVMRKERPLNLNYPMTLAETASTFAETLLTDAMLRSPDSSAALKLSLLATRLDHAVAFLLNIPSRFDFERQFYEERAQGEVSVSRIKEILLASQRACMGDVIDPDEEDAYFWASKLHFYITEVSFYNFPYSFGYLFSLGIYAQADKEGPDFYPRYEELLRRTGSDTAENIARQSLGVDLENPQFWLDSIAMVERDLRAFQIQAKAIFLMFKRLACCLLGSWLTLAGIAAAEIGPDDVLYFPMTDRYYRSGEPPPGVELQPSNPLGWHGGNLRGLSEKADYIHDLGVTVLWLAPFMQNTDEHHFGTFVGKGFHGYWIHDHERVEPHQGTEADLVNTVKTFKSKGMKVIADIVLNQVGPDHPWVKDPSKVDWFHHEGPIQNYDDEHQAEFGDLGGLPDLDQENPEVYRYLLKNTADWVTKLNLDGIRFDAVRHVGKAFWKRFIPDLRRATGKPDLFVLGEVFKGDPAYIAEYQKLGFDYLFDMPLRDTIVEVIGKGQTATLFSHRFAQDKIYPDAHKLVTLIDNHDMPRFITAALGDFDTRLQRLKQACAFLISVRGLPSFYYGTEVAMEGGPDPDNRKDMDFGRNRKMRRYFSHLMEIRSSSTALRQGSQRELLADRDVYAFARYSPQQEAVCIFNFSDQPQKRDLGVGLGQEFTDLLTDEVIDARGGHLRLKMAPHGALLLVRP